MFHEMISWLTLGFMDGVIDPLTAKLSTIGSTSHAFTRGWSDPKKPQASATLIRLDRIWIFLNYSEYDLLLRDDLTDCDRMGVQ